MMQKSTTFTTIFRVKKCYFHYDRYYAKIFFLNTDRTDTSQYYLKLQKLVTSYFHIFSFSV
jgi:hypothetical protein